MGRSAVGASGTWLLSCLPVALPALWAPAEASLGDASRLALAALPWLAWIGIPWGERADSSRAGSTVSTAALAAPPLAAALTVDLGHGRSLAALAWVAIASLVMIGLLARAARRAGESRARAQCAAIAWILLVPGLPLLESALESGGAPSFGAAPRWLTALADASPLAWAWQRAHAQVSDDRGAMPWAALAVCVGLLAIRGFSPEVVDHGTVEPEVVETEAAS